MITTAKILSYDGRRLLLEPETSIERELLKKQIGLVELRLSDGREISNEQRKKIFAIIRDISLWSGHAPEYLRQYLTWDFRSQNGVDMFSLSNVDMTTAKEFIEGSRKMSEMVTPYIAVDFACVREDLYEEVKDSSDVPVFPVELYLTYPWLQNDLPNGQPVPGRG